MLSSWFRSPGALALVLALATGCGEVITVYVDGGGDAPALPDAAAGVLTVEVLGRGELRGQPQAGVVVLFHDAGGTLVDRVLTGADGRAARAHAGGSVTVAEPGANPRLTTIHDVGAGDLLTVGERPGVAADIGAATVALPTSAGLGFSYQISGPCVSSNRSASPSVTVRLLAGCDGSQPLLVQRFASTSPHPISFLYAPEVTLTAGGTTNLTSHTWQIPAALDLAMSGLDDVDQIALGVTLSTQGRSLATISSDLADVDDAGMFELALPFPAGAIGDATAITIAAMQTGADRVQWLQDSDGTRRTAFTATRQEMLRWPPAATASATQVSWAAGAVDPAADGVYVGLTAMVNNEAAATWNLIVPPATGEVSLPALPTDLAALWQPESVAARLWVVESTLDGGYDGFRTDADARAARGFQPGQPATPYRLRVAMAQ